MVFKNKTDLFNYVWETREHVSEFSGDPLLPKGHPQWHWQMAHILPYGSYPSYKFRPDNIALITVHEHETQESLPQFRERYEQMNRLYYKEIYHKNFD